MAKKKRDRSPTGNTHDLPGMVLEVNDFGPIQKGRVDLRPLTVFAGPSNTGKSWLAILIYAMEQHVEAMSFELYEFLMQQSQNRKRADDGKLEDGIKLFLEIFRSGLQDLKEHGKLHLKPSEIEITRELIKPLVRSDLGHELRRCYGVKKVSDLIRQHHEGETRLSIHSGQMDYCLSIPSQRGKISLGIDVPQKIMLSASSNNKQYFDKLIKDIEAIREPDREVAWPSFRHIAHMIWTSLYSRTKNHNTYYLPADRGGVMHAHSVVVGALIRNASRAGLYHESPLPVLSGVLGDFLENLLHLMEFGGRDSKKHGDDLARILENRILRGAIEVERGETDHPRFVYRPQGWQRTLPLMNVSSMVSELTPVALYLRHLVRPGDLLIIEEPEAHLHPAMQARFTEAIAAVVQAGVRVLLTTHSEWVLEELANIVARSETKKDDVEHGEEICESVESREGRESDVVGLPSKDVGVWLFDFADKDRPEQGSEIREVPWNPDEGGYMAGFDEVAMDLHNDWARLMSRDP